MTVYLVGAGPGDAGLMTVRSLELIAAADVILYDRLIPDGALDRARTGALLIDVGKVGGGEQVPQEATNELLLEHGAAGRAVVRLKGGDPFVFGRGGEEAQLLRAAGIDVEVVPGVTAGVAAPAYAGIPVTQRGMAAAVAFVTGHEDPSKDETQVDWPALAAFPGTLVFYMGVRKLGRIAERLVAGGRPASEPVAIVERGTFADQRTVTGTLADIAARASQAGVRAPAITVVGAVAALHDELAWFAAGPLRGRASPSRGRARRPAARRAARGAWRARRRGAGDPHRAAGRRAARRPGGLRPALRDEPQRRAAPARDRGDARALAGPAIAAIGPGTAEALRGGGIVARHRAAASGCRVARRGARRPTGEARADRPRRAGARGAARRPARARRRGRDPRAVSHRAPSRSRRRRSSPRSAPTT